MTMFKTLHFKTEYHYPQVERRFDIGFLFDPKNENCWIMDYKRNLGCEFPDWEPSKSYYYQYYPRAKKFWQTGLYSGWTDRLILEESLLVKLNKNLSLSPFIAFDNHIQFRETKIDILNVFFNIDILESIEITSSVFEYTDSEGTKELVGLNTNEFIDIYNMVYFPDLYNLLHIGDIEEEQIDKRRLTVKKLTMRSNYDIFTLEPFSGSIFLSQKALNFFEKEGINHVWPWSFTDFEIDCK